MNWLQKIAQSSVPPSYTDVGHGAEGGSAFWNKDLGKVIMWKYDNGYIIDAERSEEEGMTGHRDMDMENPESWEAAGRIEVDRSVGSVSFHTFDTSLKKLVINQLVSKYPGVQFFVYHDGPSPTSLQKYWSMLESGQV